MSTIPKDIKQEILARLSDVEAEQNVRMLFAVESGSRAWGFASPDSDFDVRFVYIHPPDWYLTIGTPRDVIELPIDEVYDINGWDLKKALQLLIKPNPVLLEWLGSPVVYRADESATNLLRDLARQTGHVRPSQYHYLHLGQGQYHRHIASKDKIKIKKYFYVLRPAMALQWLREVPDAHVPVDFRTLMNGIELRPDIVEEIEKLLDLKMDADEADLIERSGILDTYIESEFIRSKEDISKPAAPAPKLLSDADEVFRALIRS